MSKRDKKEALAPALLDWYDKEKRLLPWRENTDPYRIWVSEIMLQQTQVVTVIPYFHRFMDWFPTIQALAEAEEDKLLKAWEGLGYYSRVRNMQIAAQDIVERFDGQMPGNLADIMSLKGIGPYTGGAIGSIAFELPVPAVDGNVMRVYSRLYQITDDIGKAKTRKVFEEKVTDTISQTRPGDYNQALMDLGSRICTPTSPDCAQCPLAKYCDSYEAGDMTSYPVKAKKVKSVPLYYVGMAIQNAEGAYLIEKRPDKGLLAKMWTFPMFEVSSEAYEKMKQEWVAYESDKAEANLFAVAESPEVFSETAFVDRLSVEQEAPIWQKQPLGEITHVFSHRKWHLLLAYGREGDAQVMETDENREWVLPKDFKDYVFPKPQQKMVEVLLKDNKK